MIKQATLLMKSMNGTNAQQGKLKFFLKLKLNESQKTEFNQEIWQK